MLEGLAGDTRIIVYLMAGIGVLGILAKIINQLTLYRLVRAAGNMPKSTHRLIRLVRAKYEHACMIHDSVENIDAFVKKYIYEYRGFLFRIHTWRQIETLSVWFAGILAALGAWVYYLSSGLTEAVYQYIAAGLAEMVLLSVIMRLSDEPYKINAIRMYMVDYLENICAFRLRKQNQRERESIDVISAETGGKSVFQPVPDSRGQEDSAGKKAKAGRSVQTGMAAGMQPDIQPVMQSEVQAKTHPGQERYASRESRGGDAGGVPESAERGSGTAAMRADRKERLPINIEGEPRAVEKVDTARQALRSAASESNADNDRTALREEAIRQILEEFLA